MATASSLPFNLSCRRFFSPRRALIALAIIASFLFQFSVAWMLRQQIATGVTDFAGLYTGGKIVASGNGANLYNLATQQRVEGSFTVRGHSAGFLSFTPHAPIETLLFAPLTAFPFAVAAWIWWVCNLLLAYLVLYLLRFHLPGLNRRLDLAILGLGCFLPLLTAECQGQNSVLTLLFAAACFLYLAQGRAWMAGSALAMTTYKPQFALVMIVLLAITSERRWRILKGFFATCLALALLSIAVVGWSACAAYPISVASLAAGSGDAQQHTFQMPNLRGLLFTLAGSHGTHAVFAMLVAAVSALFVLAAVWASRGKGTSAQIAHLQFALLVTVAELVSYHGFLHDMTILLLPLFLVWNSLAETGTRNWRRWPMAASILLLFCGPFLAVRNLQFYTCITIVFFALLCWEVRIRNRNPA